VIPFLGGLIGAVWALVITIIGLAQAHGTSGGRAAAAVLVPLGVCCLAVLALAGLFAFTLTRSLGGW
jgi:hypothetical protein